MENERLGTDAKLVRLLSGGDDFRRLVDPERLTRDGVVRKLFHSSPAGMGLPMQWKVFMVFPCGESVVMSVVLDKGEASVHEVWMTDGDGSVLNVPVKASKTLAGALGSMSDLPVRLKRCLCPAGPETVPSEEFVRKVEDFVKLESDGLFWGVEGGLPEDGFRERFTDFVSRYVYDPSGICSKVSFVAKSSVSDGRVRLVMDADVFGLGSKAVYLDRGVGMGAGFRAECLREKDGKEFPSLVVAFDLNARVPVFYTAERYEGRQLGTMKAKTKR